MNKTTKTPQQLATEEQRRQLVAATRTVERILGIRRSTQESTMYESGIQWVESQFYYDPARIAQFIDSPVFWSWWLKQWYMRNYELLMRHGLSLHHSKPLSESKRNELIDDLDTHHKMAFLQFKPSPMLIKAVVSNHYKSKG